MTAGRRRGGGCTPPFRPFTRVNVFPDDIPDERRRPSGIIRYFEALAFTHLPLNASHESADLSSRENFRRGLVSFKTRALFSFRSASRRVDRAAVELISRTNETRLCLILFRGRVRGGGGLKSCRYLEREIPGRPIDSFTGLFVALQFRSRHLSRDEPLVANVPSH